ncbi:putative duf1479 domain protein [Phaeoacremonium minimum UCRPA7]|uniref:Putative duf1479 domain protein n=1 Tax=Phaeoacremonium minimum (strain UCR-PA7) TaxID=1286976 RepID=R8BPK8_PHAM7|nr:putative duf1479 domain protein [Phaeoacremonium minimum UCRPA7]EOO01230.1 putative duf1479 domain protein [Phaeoacremonium minimum UCRPA7]
MLNNTIKRAIGPTASHVRTLGMAAMSSAGAAPLAKKEGDISDSFGSLSGTEAKPLPDSFRELKLSLVAGREEQIKASWNRLLQRLKIENDIVAQGGSNVIPEVQYDELLGNIDRLKDEIHKRGVVVIRGVIGEAEARAYKSEIEEYVRKNPSTRGRR